MLREIVWQEPGYFGFDEPDKLHHTATLVSQNVTVEHVRAGEVHKLVANPGPVGRHPAVDRLAARRAIRYGDGILPAAPSAGSGSPEEFMPRLRQMAEDAGRDPQSLSVTLGARPRTSMY
jgi:alkanesulfonate monooxygenase SsuD/methylene tetrahydromethanopterin reductase-like flavin-dependent oxidoreductase (luciferase family)